MTSIIEHLSFWSGVNDFVVALFLTFVFWHAFQTNMNKYRPGSIAKFVVPYRKGWQEGHKISCWTLQTVEFLNPQGLQSLILIWPSLKKGIRCCPLPHIVSGSIPELIVENWSWHWVWGNGCYQRFVKLAMSKLYYFYTVLKSCDHDFYVLALAVMITEYNYNIVIHRSYK